MILGKEIDLQEQKIPFCRLNSTKQVFSSARLPYTVQKSAVRTVFVLNNRNTIDINCVLKRLQPLHYCETSSHIKSIV